jgi:hypothetical protein
MVNTSGFVVIQFLFQLVNSVFVTTCDKKQSETNTFGDFFKGKKLKTKRTASSRPTWAT